MTLRDIHSYIILLLFSTTTNDYTYAKQNFTIEFGCKINLALFKSHISQTGNDIFKFYLHLPKPLVATGEGAMKLSIK